MKVELIYDPDCPNAAPAREALLRAFARADEPPHWTEWDRSAPDAPAYAKDWGSPTILIDGNDLAEDVEVSNDACRLYAGPNGRPSGVPPVDLIAGRLIASRERGSSGTGGLLAAFPAAAAFLVPIGFCPACWPAYGAILGSLGLGFTVSSRFLLPLAGVLLLVTLAALAYRAPRRRGYAPFLLGAVGAATASIGKLAAFSDPIVYLGLTAILTAAVWNAWPRRRRAPCPRCIEPSLQQEKETSP